MNKQLTPPPDIERGHPCLRREYDGHFFWLDLIRFLAAFAVLASHFRGAFFVDYGSLPSSQQNIVTSVIFAATRLGHEAVLVFFVLSGFLVGGKALSRIKDDSFNPRSYAIDRAVRILLPLISSLLLFAIVCFISGQKFPIYNALGNLLSLQGILCPVSFETLWSLSYEVWFYILMCAFGYSLAKRGKWKVFIAIGVFTICMLVFTKLDAYYLFIWLIGALGFFIAPFRRKQVCLITIGLTIVMLGMLQLTSETHTAVSGNVLSVIPRPIIEICFGAVFCVCLSQVIQYVPTSKFGLKINDIGTRLAAFSYTLYLTHIPVRDLLWYLGAPKATSLTLFSISLYVLWLIVAMVVAYGMYYVFERNTNNVKKWVKRYV